MIGGIKFSTAVDDLGEGIAKQPVSQNKAFTNFALTLPEGQSDLLQAITRDPYNFEAELADLEEEQA